MDFRIYGIRKSWLKKSLKSLLSGDPSTSNMLRGPNTVEISITPHFPYFSLTVKATELEKTSLSDMKSPKTVSSHIDCQ